jgi:catechol 2,3-dioxygenase-like lactoylglutathione lyase family enzyme
MSVQVYGINHLAIEVDDVAKALAFYEDVFQLEKMDEGEGDAFFKIGETSSSPFLRWKSCSRIE